MDWSIILKTSLSTAILLAGLAGCSSNPARRYAPITDASGAIRAHPFLFFTEDDLPRLRAATRTTHRVQFERLQAWGRLFGGFEPLATAKLPNDRDTMQVYYENGANFVFNMSLLYQLTGDETSYKAAEKWLLAFTNYPVEIDGGYFVGAYALALASGYDLLYPRLSADQRVQVRDHLAAVLERGRIGTRTDWWAGLRLHHDHWLPAAGLCVGALALVDGTAAADERLAFFTAHMQHAMDAVGNDGSWTEGVAQWNYALAMLAIYFDARKHVTGENLFHQPWMEKAIAYRLYQWLPGNPGGDRYIYHHDSFPNGRYNIMGAASSHLLRKLASEEKSGLAQWLARRDEVYDFKQLEGSGNGGGKPIDPTWMTSKQIIEPAHHGVGWSFLWYDPNIKPVAPTQALPNHVVFPNQGLVVLRSGWQPKDMVFTFTCAPVSGHKGRDEVLAGDKQIASNIGHIHALSGAFNLWSNSNYLAAPPGYGMRESSNENTLTIEGCDQYLDPRYDAKILALAFGDGYAYMAGDATDCYPKEAGLKRQVRHVAWLAPDVFVIADELQAQGTSARGRDTVWRVDYIPEINQAVLDPAAGKARIVSRESGQLGALGVQFLAPGELQMEDAAVKHQWTQLPSSVVGGLRLEDKIVKSPAGWIAYGQVRASVRDIFRKSSEARIVAVLSALENRSTSLPAARLIEADHAMGAVVDGPQGSRAAVFTLDGSQPSSQTPLHLDVTAKSELKCLIFGLAPGSSWDVAVDARSLGASKANTAVYSITIKPGRTLKATAEGVLTIQQGHVP